jgi:hypothetical protein
MQKKTVRILFASAVATLATQSVFAGENVGLIIRGPIDSVDNTSNTVTVLGQRISVPNVAEMSVGSVVNVYGRLEATGRISSAAVENLAYYASGADSLYLRGIVSAVSQKVGRLRIASTEVDYTSLLASPEFRIPSLGDVAEFAGTVPNTGGVFLASAVIGTGKVQAVIGTGREAQAVIGTGKVQAVIGTGREAQAVIGTGKVQAVIGTGREAQAVIGTGKVQAVIGTGREAQAVIGTGKVQAVIGTGREAQAVIGTGQS